MFSLKIEVENSEVVLFGPDIVDPVKGARRRPCSQLNNLVEEKIEVILHGAPGTIDSWLRMVEALFSQMYSPSGENSSG